MQLEPDISGFVKLLFLINLVTSWEKNVCVLYTVTFLFFTIVCWFVQCSREPKRVDIIFCIIILWLYQLYTRQKGRPCFENWYENGWACKGKMGNHLALNARKRLVLCLIQKHYTCNIYIMFNKQICYTIKLKHTSNININYKYIYNYNTKYKCKLDNPNIVQQSPPGCQFDFNVYIL